MYSTNRNLKDLLFLGKTFVIPSYQRGYIWGKSRNSQKNSVEYMLDSILAHEAEDKELFIQGITVSETDNEIEIIDGQQRITFFYLLLKYLNSDILMRLNYQARAESRKFLFLRDAKWKNFSENENEQSQDIYYFKKTIRLIRERLTQSTVATCDIVDYILERIRFLYIDLPKEKAVSVFTMMNGNKANMRSEEIIKAELLRLASPAGPVEFDKDSYAVCWEQDLLRSKYAREWDKWLYWWNRGNVKKFYHTDNGMELLIRTFFDASSERNGKKEVLNFENFRSRFLTEKVAKETFNKLRCLQKRFEDTYQVFDQPSAERHNKVGAILTLLEKEDRTRFTTEYFGSDTSFDLDAYYKLVFLGGLTHTVIRAAIKEECPDDDKENVKKAKEAKETVAQQKQELLRQVQQDDLYCRDKDSKECAFRQLLRLNIEEDSKLGRAFDFSIWKNRSLEHIFPKSKVYYRDDDGLIKTTKENDDTETLEQEPTDMLNRSEFGGKGSEHCIGNLVLLYKDDNSKFGDKLVEDKKAVYFDLSSEFHSRHLLHTISVFARKNWGVPEIQENMKNIIEEIKSYYEIPEAH